MWRFAQTSVVVPKGKQSLLLFSDVPSSHSPFRLMVMFKINKSIILYYTIIFKKGL